MIDSSILSSPLIKEVHEKFCEFELRLRKTAEVAQQRVDTLEHRIHETKSQLEENRTLHAVQQSLIATQRALILSLQDDLVNMTVVAAFHST